MDPGPSLFDRHAKEARELAGLAPWALKSAQSRGRKHPEAADELRTEFERDRDRIVHCTGFRRLMYKTQVFVNWEGDHFRTRLSHSIEVAQVARSIGSALALNESFCEALALAHDIGHPPFGHRGEWALDELMRGHGGFRHNFQVLRVVDLLERRSPDYAGLNLTRELRESLLKHEKDEDWPDEFRPKPQRPYLEAQVVDLADSTAYDMHDVEDGLAAGMFEFAELERDCELWRRAQAAVDRRHPRFLEATEDEKLRVKRIANEMLKLCITDLIHASAERIASSGVRSPDGVRDHGTMLIGHSPELKRQVAELEIFLDRRFYKHAHLSELTKHAAATLRALFEGYVARPEEMAPWYRRWAEQVGLQRSVCDYIAGMTDRFAQQEYARLNTDSTAGS
jgi:dGTPase